MGGSPAGIPQGGHGQALIFRPPCTEMGVIWPAVTERWRVHCSRGPFPGIPVPMRGMHRAKAEQLAECSWAALIPGLTPHGLRHGHQTAMRRDRVPRVLRRDRLGHGASGDIADHYTHIDDEMIGEMLPARRGDGRRRSRHGRASTRPAAPSRGRPCRPRRVAGPVPGARRGIQLPSALPSAGSGGGSVNVLPGGRNWDRTSDPSLVRRGRTVAGRGWTWPGVASASHDCGWTWPGVA